MKNDYNQNKENTIIAEKNPPQKNTFGRKKCASGSTRDIYDAQKKDNDLVTGTNINIKIKSKDKCNNRCREKGYNNNYIIKTNKFWKSSNYIWKVNNTNDEKEPNKWRRYNKYIREDN
jgi:hypothetical protein